MTTDISAYINQKVHEIFPKIKSIREQIHANPELSFEEHETMKFVAEHLNSLGIQCTTKVGGTGVVAVLGSNKKKDAIGLRADLDALPITEENETSYISKNKGVMHACGHDVHTSILLGVAEILKQIEDQLPQPVKLIFQPGEEKNPGGATYMIKDKVLENPRVEKMIALHVFPELEHGHVGFKEGLYMASCDELHITINGKGGHGAMPHKCIDPIVAGSTLVLELQKITSRYADPKIPTVLTIGHFEALGATNVIPAKAKLMGTFRTMNEVWRKEAHLRIKEICEGLSQSTGTEIDVHIDKGYPYLENDPTLTSTVRSKAIEILGEEFVHDLPIRMTAEDFSHYAQIVPVCFFRLGVANASKGIIHGVHHPKFDIDPESIKTGMKIIANSVFL